MEGQVLILDTLMTPVVLLMGIVVLLMGIVVLLTGTPATMLLMGTPATILLTDMVDMELTNIITTPKVAKLAPIKRIKPRSAKINLCVKRKIDVTLHRVAA